MIYLITYDLKVEGKDYTALYDKIKSFGVCFHPFESAWFLKPLPGVDANVITEQLQRIIDGNDHIFVVEISKKEKQGWLPVTAWEWLKKHDQ